LWFPDHGQERFVLFRVQLLLFFLLFFLAGGIAIGGTVSVQQGRGQL